MDMQDDDYYQGMYACLYVCQATRTFLHQTDGPSYVCMYVCTAQMMQEVSWPMSPMFLPNLIPYQVARWSPSNLCIRYVRMHVYKYGDDCPCNIHRTY